MTTKRVYSYQLNGRMMDTSDNWLPNVHVKLRKANVATHTDGNGLFHLEFQLDEPLEADDNGAFDQLEVSKDDHRPRAIQLKTESWFHGEHFDERMEPRGVSPDNLRIPLKINPAGSIPNLPRLLGLAAGARPSVEELADGLAQLARAPQSDSSDLVDAAIYGWVAPETRTVRAVLVVALHGMGVIDHPVLRRFAAENDVALVGFENSVIQCGWWPVDHFDPYFKHLAEQTGHPELAAAPLLTFGHSNGTGLAAAFPSARPGRVIAWASYHSGHSWHLLLPNVEKVPALIMHGQLDQWLDHGQEFAIKSLRAERNAPVAMMIEGNVGHGPVDTTATWEFVVDFYQAALATRLTSDGKIRPVDMQSGWLGDTYDRSRGGQQLLHVAPYREFPSAPAQANWLINEAFAKTWQKYGATNPVQ